mgnify:CR=1 FL=1
MAVMNGKIVLTFRTVLCAVAAACLLGGPAVALAQTADNALTPKISDDAKLFLSSDTLVYDRDNKKVTANGAVRINYSGYKLVANQVTYDQGSGRLVANGKIELVEPDGNKVYADSMDVTDDFGQGFVNALRVETTDDTHMAAESGERINSDVFILNNGVYTACKPCADHPERAPVWQVKAKKVIENGKTHTVRLESAKFELFGQPIAYLPYIEVPDHTVKRKSGFLFPTFVSAQKLGFGGGIPYYYVINPSTDLTVTPTYYSKQGLLMAAELRQQFDNGEHTLRLAGISQQDRTLFSSGTSDSQVTRRGMVQTKGEFRINPRWTFGWDVLVQSDNNFSRTYSLWDANSEYHTNQIYLTGLGKRNYFDLRSFYFNDQDADPFSTAEWKQAFVHPVMDYHAVAPKSFLGGELTLDANFTNLTHRGFDVFSYGTTNRFLGLRGESSRFTANVQWKRQFITDGGLVVTPILAARGDAFQLGMQNPSASGYSYAGSYYGGAGATRTMLTAGTEVRYPFLITMPGSEHVIEPVGQIFVRPNEQLAGRLPNDDAQSFVFDATNLFEMDKFSGYDRVEGGTRANLGLRYTGTFDSGYRVNAIAGESFQVAGLNSFATGDLTYAGANSGLDKKASDYVGMVSMQAPNGIGLMESARFDHDTLKLARLASTVSYTNSFSTSSLTYNKVGAQPQYGTPTDRDELIATTSLKIKDYWKLYTSITWDLNSHVLNAGTVGVAYDDGCTFVSVGFSEARDFTNSVANDWSIGARISFRTLGDIRVGDTTATSSF